jgi:hypothetical protein
MEHEHEEMHILGDFENLTKESYEHFKEINEYLSNALMNIAAAMLENNPASAVALSIKPTGKVFEFEVRENSKTKEMRLFISVIKDSERTH